MNEELKIIIKAITDPAQKSLAEVKEQLGDIGDTASKSGETVNKAMAVVGKSALAVVGTITALTTALVALGKSSLEFQKRQAQLIAGFQSVGLSAEQAGKTYRDLFGFLGETDTAVEAANLLAQLTQNEKDLTEWTQILQGVYAKFPSSLPVESLAEAINHTAQLGEVQGTLADALEWSGVSVEQFNARLANTTSVAEREAIIRSTLNNLYMTSSKLYAQNNQALIQYNQSQVALDQALAQATAYVIPLMTALNQLAATLLSVLRPAFENISAVLVAFVQWIMAAIKAVGAFFGVFGGEGASSTKAVSTAMGAISINTSKVTSGVNKLENGFTDASKAAEKLRKQTMGFDELNILNSQQTTDTSAPGLAGMGFDPSALEIPEIEVPVVAVGDLNIPGLDDFEEKVSKIKEYLDPIAVLVGTIGAGLLVWKIVDFIKELTATKGVINLIKNLTAQYGDDAFKRAFGETSQEMIDKVNGKHTELIGTLKKLGAEILVVSGLILTVAGYSHAWVEGVSWGNLAVTLAGLGATITGIGLLFGTLAASVATVFAGIGMLILGVKDFIDQGPTLQNTILIIGGAIAIAVAAATAGLSVLVSAIIGAVAAVAAFTAAILLEEPAIMTVKEAQEALTAAKEAAAAAENTYINAVDAADAALKRLQAAEQAAGMTGAELYAQVQAGTLDYQNMDATQRELYKAYLDNEQKQKDLKLATEELTAAKQAETIASFEHQLALAKESGDYETFKQAVISAYEEGSLSADEARTLIEKSMSEMSDASQQTFMKDIPSDITNGLDPHRYESTRTKITKWFKNAWDEISTNATNAWNTVGANIKKMWDDLKSWFNSKIKPIFTKQWWTNKWNSIKEGARAAFNGVIDVVERAVNGIIRKINTLSWKIPDWVPVFGGDTFGFNLRTISIPRLAEGGIVNSSILANIGERGKEAVLPLESNTEWMDALADRIAARNNTPSKIVLMVDKKELGYATIGSINGITKQTGKLPLVFA